MPADAKTQSPTGFPITYAQVDDFFAVEPGGMMHVVACSAD